MCRWKIWANERCLLKRNREGGFPLRFSACRLVNVAVLLACSAMALYAQSADSLASRVEKIISRPEFAHSNFGIEFDDLESGKVLYSLNAEKLFVPASTTKLLTEGTVLAKLGPNYRFRTPIYRTGPIDKHGT